MWHPGPSGLHFLAFDESAGPLLGSSPSPSPPIPPLHRLRHRLSRPLPASRGLSTWDRLSDAQMGQGPLSRLITPRQVPSRQHISHRGWGSIGSSRPYLGASSPLESRRRALGPTPLSSEWRQSHWRPSIPTRGPGTAWDFPLRVCPLILGEVLAPRPIPVQTPALSGPQVPRETHLGTWVSSLVAGAGAKAAKAQRGALREGARSRGVGRAPPVCAGRGRRM